MDCVEARGLLPELLKREGDRIAAVEAHLEACPACRREFDSLDGLWRALGRLDQPESTPALRARVAARRSAVGPWTLAAAAVLGLIAAGVALGRPRPRQLPSPESGLLQLIHSPAAGERLKGLALLGTSDNGLTETLLALLEQDPDPRVRLAAVEALHACTEDPRLQERLGAVALQQEHLEVQLALIDLAMVLRERRALVALRRLAAEGKLGPEAARRLGHGSPAAVRPL